MLEDVQNICPKDVTIMHVRQGEAKGLGHAVLCALPVVGDEPFAVVLPDVLIDEYDSDLKKDNLAQMISLFCGSGHSQVMVEPVPLSTVSSYGVADVAGCQILTGESAQMTAIVEKPSVDEAPSNLAVVGRYVFSSDIWPLLQKTPVGAGDEIQLTDAIAMLMQQQQVNAYHIKGRSHDCGNKLGYVTAFLEYALRDPALADDLKKKFKQWI